MLTEERERAAAQVCFGVALSVLIFFSLVRPPAIPPTTLLQSQTLAQHKELVAKVEKLHLLEDSNRLLRDENTHLTAKVTELTKKATMLEEQLQPLRQSKEE